MVCYMYDCYTFELRPLSVIPKIQHCGNFWHIKFNRMFEVAYEFIVVMNEVSAVGVATRLQADQLRYYFILG